jgi:hypothetical protein
MEQCSLGVGEENVTWRRCVDATNPGLCMLALRGQERQRVAGSVAAFRNDGRAIAGDHAPGREGVKGCSGRPRRA